MADEANNTPGAAVITPPEKTVEKTIGDIQNDGAPKKEETPTVGLDKFLEVKKQNKEKDRAIANLTARLENGADADDVADDIEALAEEHDIDKGFLKKLVRSIESKAEKSLEDRINAKLAPIQEKEKAEKIDKAFKGAFDGAMEQMPEFKTIVNPEVIKTLSLDPKNANKTFTELIEETYGSAVPGKRTLEKTTPGGGKEPTEVDFTRAKSDPEYFSEVMKNPDLKKKYNAGLTERVGKFM